MENSLALDSQRYLYWSSSLCFDVTTGPGVEGKGSPGAKVHVCARVTWVIACDSHYIDTLIMCVLQQYIYYLSSPNRHDPYCTVYIPAPSPDVIHYRDIVNDDYQV